MKRKLEQIVQWWIPRLGLSHWTIDVEVSGEPFENGAAEAEASTWRPRDYETARVVFNPNELGDWTPLKAHRVAVHELLHLVTRDVEYVLDLLDGLLSRDADELVERAHRHAVEESLDRLAYRIVDLATIPPSLL